MLTDEAIMYGQIMAKAQGLRLIGMTESKNYGKDEDLSITFVFNKEGVDLK